MLITLDMMERAGNSYDCKLFTVLCELGQVEITEEFCIKNVQDLDWDWLAQNILPSNARWEYDKEQAGWSELIGPIEYATRCARLFYKASHKK